MREYEDIVSGPTENSSTSRQISSSFQTELTSSIGRNIYLEYFKQNWQKELPGVEGSDEENWYSTTKIEGKLLDIDPTCLEVEIESGIKIDSNGMHIPVARGAQKFAFLHKEFVFRKWASEQEIRKLVVGGVDLIPTLKKAEKSQKSA